MLKIIMNEKNVPPYKMRSADFVSSAITLVVNPAMVGGDRRLVCTEAAEPDRVRVEQELKPFAPYPTSDAAVWARDRVDALLAVPFQEDAWFAPLPSGATLVLLKERSIEGRMEVPDALRRIHVAEVARALSSGLEVPAAVVDDYRVFIESVSSQREAI